MREVSEMLSLFLDRSTVYKEMVNDKWLSQAVHKFQSMSFFLSKVALL